MYSAKKNETRDLIALAQYEYSIWPSCHNQIILSSIQYYHFIPQNPPLITSPTKTYEIMMNTSSMNILHMAMLFRGISSHIIVCFTRKNPIAANWISKFRVLTKKMTWCSLSKKSSQIVTYFDNFLCMQKVCDVIISQGYHPINSADQKNIWSFVGSIKMKKKIMPNFHLQQTQTMYNTKKQIVIKIILLYHTFVSSFRRFRSLSKFSRFVQQGVACAT